MSRNQLIHAQAPTRIDLAGGTIDLWPLYLFLERPTTVNLAVDLMAQVTLESLGQAPSGMHQPSIELCSVDQQIKQHWSWEEWESLSLLSVPTELRLPARFLRHTFGQMVSGELDAWRHRWIRLTTQAQSPAGAGLGGSSSLCVALVAALEMWRYAGPEERAVGPLFDVRTSGRRIVETARDLETQLIGVPAGVQDYYAAVYGGLQSWMWGVERQRNETFSTERMEQCNERVLLFYSGQSRHSGVNNWKLYQAFINELAIPLAQGAEHSSALAQNFMQINRAAQGLTQALQSQDWRAVGSAIDGDWRARQRLAPTISTPEIDAALQEAQTLVPCVGKVCGAGGGGCFMIFLLGKSLELSTHRELLVRALSAHPKMRHLPVNAVVQGLSVRLEQG